MKPHTRHVAIASIIALLLLLVATVAGHARFFEALPVLAS